ncbi:hypothetical protein, unlikely [Trypanosoma congolense IL3000]|uniref:Uncharacterized protein n=1 Tax=Trypanosoma congolense (strain IL3000) TaxID=1068625 RepID=F9W6Z7_TRYCI|nr:hypothetical protein, unlikely [Trypanosoma congolense IL3000]
MFFSYRLLVLTLKYLSKEKKIVSNSQDIYTYICIHIHISFIYMSSRIYLLVLAPLCVRLFNSRIRTAVGVVYLLHLLYSFVLFFVLCCVVFLFFCLVFAASLVLLWASHNFFFFFPHPKLFRDVYPSTHA